MFREGFPAGYLIAGFSIGVLVVATLLLIKIILAIVLSAIAVTMHLPDEKADQAEKEVDAFHHRHLGGIASLPPYSWCPFLFTKVLQKYQVERIFSLIGKENPYAKLNTVEGEEPASTTKKDTDYNVRQSKIAIGSRLRRKGFTQGHPNPLRLCAEQRTDFIFCTIGEGFGFLGCALVLGIYSVFIIEDRNIAERQRSAFSRCYAYGVASVFFFHIAINICMTIGLAPVIGIPLPLSATAVLC